MEKFLIEIEFRYADVPKYEEDSSYVTKCITVGVFDTMDEAIIEGNKALEIFERYFPLNTAWNTKRRFGKHKGVLGKPSTLITGY